MIFMKKTAVIILVLNSTIASALANSFKNADFELNKFETIIQRVKNPLSFFPANSANKVWLKAKISEMASVDQVGRLYPHAAVSNTMPKDEKEYFTQTFFARLEKVDNENREMLKTFLQNINWFTISEFGQQTDNEAWLIVQHQDQDVAFQKMILSRLELLYAEGNTNPSNYAYLFDRVAVNETRLQRYGSQGMCVGSKKWEPRKMETPEKVDERRNSVGLPPMADYIELVSQYCD